MREPERGGRSMMATVLQPDDHAAVDVHAHWTPDALADALRRRERIPRIDGPAGAETYHSIYGDRPFTPLEGDLDARRALMDAHGIGVQVLSLPGLFGVDSLPVDEALPLVTLFNDAAARRCSGRFLALAALPHRDIAAACTELRRALALGLRGAILPADGFATLDAARRFEPLLAVAAELRAHLFIHPGPTVPPPDPAARPSAPDSPWLRHIVLGTQARLSEVMVTLNFSDLLDPWPELTVQVANLGGGMPFYLERIGQVSRTQLGDSRPVQPRLRRCFVDTSSFGPRAVAMAVECFGADRVMLGSDCPIFEAGEMRQALRDANLGADQREQVAAGNARRLFGLPAPSGLSAASLD